MPPRWTAEEIAQRMPLWQAFADLFLDTDPALHYSSIVRVLQHSPFTREQLRGILCDEVAPAFLFNLSLVAGEWAMWDERFVRERMLAVRERSRWLRWLDGPTGKRNDTYAHEQWLKLVELWDSPNAPASEAR